MQYGVKQDSLIVSFKLRGPEGSGVFVVPGSDLGSRWNMGG